MVNCSYCNKELDRQVFCNRSHKVMYHTKKLKQRITTIEDLSKEKDGIIKVKEFIESNPLPPNPFKILNKKRGELNADDYV